jgi:hypothetical protein
MIVILAAVEVNSERNTLSMAAPSVRPLTKTVDESANALIMASPSK